MHTGEDVDLVALAEKYLCELEKNGFEFLKSESNKGELAAFIAYALSFPTDFLALVDTYNVMKYDLNSQATNYYRIG